MSLISCLNLCWIFDTCYVLDWYIDHRLLFFDIQSVIGFLALFEKSLGANIYCRYLTYVLLSDVVRFRPGLAVARHEHVRYWAILEYTARIGQLDKGMTKGIIWVSKIVRPSVRSAPTARDNLS